MIKNIIELLEIAKEQKLRGKYINIALGKHKMPETINETIEITKLNYGR